MSLNYFNLIVADTRISRLSGRSALYGYRLAATLEILPNSGSPQHEGIVISDLVASVSCARQGGAMKYLGRAYPEMPQWVRNQQFPQPSAVLLEVDLAPPVLAAMERERAGGALDFEFKIRASGMKNGEAAPVVDTIKYSSNLSEWSQVLEDFGHSDLFVFGVAVPRSELGQQLRAASDRLSRAHQDFVQGRYDDVVGRARHIIESVWAFENSAREAAAATKKYFGGERAKMTKRERALFLQEAVRHYAHPPHHDAGAEEFPGNWYSAEDAGFILALAAAVLAEVTSRAELPLETSSLAGDQKPVA